MTMLTLNAGHLSEADSDLTEVSLADFENGVRPSGPFAIVAPNHVDVETLGAEALRADGVILEFPVFSDGRAYSQAKLLRSRLKYAGQIRARGDVLCDQVLFMARSGFDAFEIGDGAVDGFKAALGEFRHFYQSSADDVTTVIDRRHNRAAAA